MKLNLFLALLLVVLFSSANAQFRLGVQGSMLKLPQSVGNYGTSYGPGVDFAFSPDESKIEYYLNVAYFLPASAPGYYTFYTADGSNSTNGPGTDKTSLIGFVLGSRYFFLDREDNDFNIYGTANANYVFANTKSVYTVPAGYVDPGSSSGNSNQLMIGLGIGFEYKLNDAGSIFAEGQFRFPATTYNSRDGYSEDVQIPAHPWLSVGYKFSFGGGSGY